MSNILFDTPLAFNDPNFFQPPNGWTTIQNPPSSNTGYYNFINDQGSLNIQSQGVSALGDIVAFDFVSRFPNTEVHLIVNAVEIYQQLNMLPGQVYDFTSVALPAGATVQITALSQNGMLDLSFYRPGAGVAGVGTYEPVGYVFQNANWYRSFDSGSTGPTSWWDVDHWNVIATGSCSLERTVNAVAGELVEFDIVSLVSGGHCTVYINGAHIWSADDFSPAMEVGRVYTFRSAPLAPDDYVSLQFFGGSSSNYTVTPYAQRVLPMHTAGNMLFMVSNLVDQDGALDGTDSPPPSWFQTPYEFRLTTGDFITYTSLVPAIAGDFVMADIISPVTGATYEFEINGVMRDSWANLQANILYRLTRWDLNPGDFWKLTISVPFGNTLNSKIFSPRDGHSVLFANTGLEVRDVDNTVPPSGYSNAGAFPIHRIIRGDLSETISDYQFAFADDTIAFDIVAQRPNQAVRVIVEGGTVFQQDLVEGTVYSFTSNALADYDDYEVILETIDGITPSLDVIISPPGTGVAYDPNGGGGTVSNFLFTPSNFHENGTSNEPASWSALNGNYHLQSSGTSPYFLSVVAPQAGDTIAFELVNRIAGLIVSIEVNGNVELSANMNGIPLGSVATFSMPSVLQAGDTVRVTFATTDVNDAIDVTVWPPGLGVADPTPPPDPAAPPPTGPDTYGLKGFVSIGELASNVPNVVAPLGELSVYSQTFAKDRELFGTSGGQTDSPINVTVFSSKNAAGGVVPVNVNVASAMTDFSKWAYEQAEFGVFTSDSDVFRQQTLAEFPSLLSDVVVGPMVLQGSIHLPEWITFYINPNAYTPSLSTPLYDRPRIKLWFSDDAFSAQYDEFKIEFIAPLDTGDLDDFFALAQVVAAEVHQRTIPQLMIKVQTAIDNQPPTVVKSIDFDYHDPVDLDNLIPTTWTFVIWGAAGDNLDAIKEQLIDWILDNSTHTREEWAEIFPDIFTSTEFILIPLWSQYAVPNRTLEEGVFSPTVNLQKGLTMARKLCVGSLYTIPHIDTHTSVFGVPYKSIAVLACGGPENRNNIDRFEEKFVDYMAVSTSSIDFNRMSQPTQQFIMLLNSMLLTAEDMDEFSDIPVGNTRIRRTAPNGDIMTYLSASYQNVQYLMASRATVYDYFPPVSVAELKLFANGVQDVYTLPSGEVGTAYTAQFMSSGGYPPVSFSLVAPKDVRIDAYSLDPVTGEFTASFLSLGAAEVKVRIQDIGNQVLTKTFILNIVGP